MMELPLIFVAGFLGSSHCIGMCGPFALLLGTSNQSWTAGFVRQLMYSAGRVFTYSMMGAVAAFCGLRLATYVPSLIDLPATLSIVAGCFLIYQGLATAGIFRARQYKTAAPCLAGGLLASFLRSPTRLHVFLAGVFTGFLPCGLVYGFVGMAASTQDIAAGMLIMAMFGLGTIPIMVATGFGGKLLSLSARNYLLRIAAWCIVVAGALSIARGAAFIGVADQHQQSPVNACPLCP